MKDGMSAVTAAAVPRAVSCGGLDRRTPTAPAGGRLGWVDIARALAMLAVIFGHVGTESVGAGYTHDGAYGLITMIINPVKLPVFFALSGYLYSHRYDDCEQLAHRTLRARLIPYAFWGSFMGLVATAMDLMRCGFDFGRLPSLLLSNYILPLLRGNLIWFIPCLTVLELIFALLLRLSRKRMLPLVLLTVLCTALGYIVSSRGEIMPWKFDTALTLAGGDMQAAGDVEATLNFPAGALPVNFARPVRIQQKFNVRYGMENRELHLRLEGSSPLSPFSFDKEAVRVESFDPVSWKFLFSQTADGGRIEDASLLIGNIKAVAHGFTATVPLLRLTGADRSFLISGSGIGVVNPERKLAVSGISLSMPLRPTPELPAELKVGKILYDGREIGDTSASLYVKDHGLSLTGRFDTKLVDGVYAEFRGRVSPRAGELPDCLFEVTVPPYTPKQPLKLGEFVPALGDATATGTVSLGGAARLENGKFTTGVHCYVYDGQFDMPESGLHAEGIKLDVRFTDLLNCDTPAGQRISIGKLNAGSLKLDNIELRFDIESRNQTIVESLRADWCGGNVMLNSLQLRTDRQFWETSLYCEGLELAELVSQLNLASAAGTGALYGKIPLRLTRGGLQIGQSYLYTRPGVSNTIRLSDPEKMVNGMAGAVAQQSQFDFALEALKDITYSWAKIHLEMQKDALAVKLQFDGQPNQALPFAYDEESGQLRRDPAARARFQGIQLNINTTIPLNYLLKLNEKVKTLTEGKK